MADVTTAQTRQQASRLRRLRERLGLSRAELTARLGFQTTQAYDLYEQAKSVIRLDRVPDWAEAFGVSEQEFMEVMLGLPPTLRERLEAAGLPANTIRAVLSEAATVELSADAEAAIAELVIEDEQERAEEEDHHQATS